SATLFPYPTLFRSTSSTAMPSARSAPAIRMVSRLCRGRRTTLGVSDSAARIIARLVIDLEPGRLTVASTGRDTVGAGQCDAVSAMPEGYPGTRRGGESGRGAVDREGRRVVVGVRKPARSDREGGRRGDRQSQAAPLR